MFELRKTLTLIAARSIVTVSRLVALFNLKLQIESQTFATSTERTQSLLQRIVNAKSLIHFSVRVETSHTASLQVG